MKTFILSESLDDVKIRATKFYLKEVVNSQ